MFESSKLTVVVCVKDGAEVIEECILSLLSQSVPIKIVVVNDGSTDKTGEVLNQFRKNSNIILVDLKKNVGLSKARNIGSKLAETELIGFIDADGQADYFWAESCVDFFNVQPESCGVMASSVRFARNPEVFNGLGGAVSIHGYGYDLQYQTPVKRIVDHEVMYAMGNGLCIRSKLLEYIDGFDELIINYYDDVDLCMRVWRSGFTVRTNSRAIVNHYFGHSSASNYKLKLHMMERNRILVVYKNYSLQQLFAFFPREILNILRSPIDRKSEIVKAHVHWISKVGIFLKTRLDSRIVCNIPSGLFTTLTDAWTGVPSNHLGHKEVQSAPQVKSIYGSFESEVINNKEWHWNSPGFKHEIEIHDLGMVEYYFYSAPGVSFMRVKIDYENSSSCEFALGLDESSMNRIRIPVSVSGKVSFTFETNSHREQGLGGRLLGVAFVSLTVIEARDLISKSISPGLHAKLKPNLRYIFEGNIFRFRVISPPTIANASKIVVKDSKNLLQTIDLDRISDIENQLGIIEILILAPESNDVYFFDLEKVKP